MNTQIRNYSNAELFQATERVVAHERDSTGVVLEHLFENDRRRAYAELGCSSLFDYCRKHLKYCSASAQLRIDAVRLMRAVPEVKDKLDDGALTLTNVNTLQRFFRNEKQESGRVYDAGQKRELLERTEGQTREQTERMLAAISPQAIPRERKRVLTPTETELKLVAGEKLMKLLGEMRDLINEPSPSYAQIFERALEIALGYKKLPQRRRAQVQVERAKGGVGAKAREKGETQLKNINEIKTTQSSFVREVSASSSSPIRPYIAMSKLRSAAASAENQCAFVSPFNGRRCESRKALQIEHIRPFAKGGSDSAENLTLLCPVHQRTRAISEFGSTKMAAYLESTGG